MEEKILTISIAAYNVEKYIGETLETLVSTKNIDKLEIFVIDDGGQDSTLEIAQKYHDLYPSSVIPVHKENGGYGTTVNYSMEHASGKYFKLLDGDDWVQTHELDRLIQYLEDSETDVVVTPFLKGPDMSEMTEINYQQNFKKNEEMLISKLDKLPLIGMWALCYKTSVLRESGLKLPGRLFYTDQFFCTLPFATAKTIVYFDTIVYCYRVGREGQSVSRESRAKNAQMTFDICNELVKFVSDNADNPNYHYMRHRVSSYYQSSLKTILLNPVNGKVVEEFRQYDFQIREISPDIYSYVTSFGKIGKLIAMIRLTKYRGLYLLKLVYPKGIPNWA